MTTDEAKCPDCGRVVRDFGRQQPGGACWQRDSHECIRFQRDAALARAEQAEREVRRLRGIIEAVRRECLHMRRYANLDDAPEVEDALEGIEALTEEA